MSKVWRVGAVVLWLPRVLVVCLLILVWLLVASFDQVLRLHQRLEPVRDRIDDLFTRMRQWLEVICPS